MGSAQDTKISVIIAGGGIAGLTLLRGLLKHPHLDPIVYEATASYGDIGGGMVLHKNAIMAMESIDPEIKEVYFRKANSMLEDDEKELATEVILAEGPFMEERLAYLGRAKGRKTVTRFDLIEGFRSLVPPERVKFYKRLSSIKQIDDGRVEASFEDGEVAIADCLVGCDGIHSKVREFLLGKDHPAANPVNHDNWFRMNCILPWEEAREKIPPKWTHFVPIVCGPVGYINMMPLNYGKTWGVTIIGHGEGSEEDKDRYLDSSIWSKYDPGVGKIIQVMRENRKSLKSWTLADHDRAPYFHHGNILMIGDAAHATMPFIGNGAAQAIEDAAVLVHVLSRVQSRNDVATAFQAVENVRKERGQSVVDFSRQCGRIMCYEVDDIPGANLYTREGVDALKAYMGDVAAFTNDADIFEQNRQGVQEFGRLIASGCGVAT